MRPLVNRNQAECTILERVSYLLCLMLLVYDKILLKPINMKYYHQRTKFLGSEKILFFLSNISLQINCLCSSVTNT